MGLVDSTTSGGVAEWQKRRAPCLSLQEDAPCTDELALVTRFCVQLLAKETTSPSSINHPEVTICWSKTSCQQQHNATTQHWCLDEMGRWRARRDRRSFCKEQARHQPQQPLYECADDARDSMTDKLGWIRASHAHGSRADLFIGVRQWVIFLKFVFFCHVDISHVLSHVHMVVASSSGALDM